MAALTVSKYLGMLQDNPFDAEAYEGLKEALASGDEERIGEAPVRLLELARVRHEERKEHLAASWLIDAELPLVADDPEFQVALLKELGRMRHEELLDDTGALVAYKKALELSPDDEDLEDVVEQIEQAAENWRKLADRFIKEAESASEATLAASMYTSAAALVWQYRKKGSAKETDELFGRALGSNAGDTRAARLHSLTLRSRKRFKDVAQILSDVADHARDRDEKVNLFVAAGRVYAGEADDSDAAAACFERVQDFVPGHEEALGFLVGHFTEREQYDHLVALYEDALRSRRNVENEQGVLLQLGMVHWRMQNQPAAAEPYFARLRKIDPTHPGMLDFYRSFYAEGDEEGRLLVILGDAQRVATRPEQKLELGLELARLATASNHVERAIDAWKSVQRLDPENSEASDQLRELFGRGEKWNALVEVLRAEMDALPAENKERRIAILRELVPIYRDHLGLDVMVVNTFNSILNEVPGDPEALRELARTYESMGRWNDLIQVLTQQAESSKDAPEKVTLYMRVAGLWIERFANYNQATKPLEEVVALEPENREALAQLKQIYAKKRAWGALFEVQLKESELTSDPEARLAMRVELAQLAGERLHRHHEAISLWKEILAEAPDTPGALDAIEKLAEREKDWGTLAEALERRVNDSPDEQTAIKTLQKLGTIYGEHLSDPATAAGAWKRVLDIDPKNGRALRTLRESFIGAKDWDGLTGLYAEAGDWEGLVDVLGTAAERADESSEKIQLSFRAAGIYEQEIGEPHRAFRNYERVLSADPANVEAARKLVPIYEKDEKWPRLIGLLEVILGGLPSDADDMEKLTLMRRIRELAVERLSDEGAAFRWAARAFAVRPSDAEVIDDLEAAADAARCHEALVEVYKSRLEESGADESLALRRRIAAISGERLGQPEEAIAQLKQILETEPSDIDSVAVLDRLYRSLGRSEELRALFVHRLEFTTDEVDRLALLLELGQLEEDILTDVASATAHFAEAHALSADDETALKALDRLHTSAENWTELEGILAKRVEVELDGAPRVNLMNRLADLRNQQLDDARGALDVYTEVLSMEPANDAAVAGLESIQGGSPELASETGRLLEEAYKARSSFEKLAGALQRRLAQTTDDDEKRALQLELAELAATELGDTEGAYKSLEAAFLDRPDDVDLWDRLASGAEAAGQQEALAQAYATAIEAGDLSADDAAELSRRVAEIYDIIIGEPEKAEPFHKRVLSADPLSDPSFNALKELYTNVERWDDLQAIYRTRIGETYDAEVKLELLMQVCFVFEEILDDPLRAITSYEEVLELSPDHVPSRRALDKLYRRAEKWAPLVTLLSRDLENAEGQEALDLTFEIAEFYETKLGEAEAAVDNYERVLEESPTHLRAQEALERLIENAEQRQRVASILGPLYEDQGAWPQLARVLSVELEAVEDAGSKVALLVRLAEIHEQKLSDGGRAFEAMKKAVEADPADATNRENLARLAHTRGGERERAEILQKAADEATEPYLQSELLFELARLWDEEEQDSEQAEQVYTRLIEVDGDNADVVLPASRALERIHLGRGDHRALAEDLRRQTKFEDDMEAKASLLVRLADLLELTLDDVEGAIGAHRERLEIDPADMDALRSLERLYERKADWPALIEALSAHEQAAMEEGEQRGLVMRIGEVYEEKLEDVDNAIIAYSDALSRFGPEVITLDALSRLYRAKEQWEDLLNIIEMQYEAAEDGGTRAEIRFQMAELMRTRTRELERAIEAYSEVLVAVPGHPGTIGALEDALTGDEQFARIEAARVLAPYYEVNESYQNLITALEVLGEVDDPSERLAALRRAADIADVGLDDAEQAFRLLGLAIRAGLEDEALPTMLTQFQRFAGSCEKWGDYATLLKGVEADVMDGDIQTEVLMNIAKVSRGALEDSESAREYYAKVLYNRPDHAAALEALEELHTEAEDFPALLEILKRKGEIAETPEGRVGILLRQAEVCERNIGDADAAIDAFESVLMEVERGEAYEGLERLYTKAERWDDLVATYERQLEAGVGDPVDARYKLGRTQLRKLNDPFLALDQLRETLAQDAGHEPSIILLEKLMEDEEHRGAAAEILEPVFLSRMDWPKVTGALEARIASEDDLEERKELFRRLGTIHEDYLEDLDGAVEAYARLFREDPLDVDIRDTLSRLANALDAWERLADIYAAALAETSVDEPETAQLASITGQLYDERVGSTEKAIPFYKSVLDFDPTDRRTFDALEAGYRRLGSWEPLLELYLQRVDVAESDAERGDILRRAATIREEKLGDVEAAVDSYRHALEVDPNDRVAIETLDRLLLQSERWDDLSDHLRFRIDGATEHEANDLKFRLAQLLATKLNDREGAVDIYEEVVLADPEHADTVGALEQLVLDEELRLRITQILEPIYRGADEWRKLIAIHEAQVQMLDDPGEKVRLLCDVARLHEERGGDKENAFRALGRAFSEDPLDEGTRGELDRLAVELGCWDEHIAAYEVGVEHCDDPTAISQMLTTMARVHDEKRGDPRSAIKTYERLLEHDRDDPTPLDALEALHTMVGDWRGLVDVMNRKVEQSYDPTERAELLRRNGSVLEELLNDAEAAIEAYRRASDEDDQDPIALEALDRLYSSAANFDELGGVLGRRFDVEEDAELKVEIGLRLGALWETQLNKPDDAIEAYVRVLETEPTQADAIEALARLYERAGMWSELLDNMRQQVDLAQMPEQRVPLIHRAGEILERELDDVIEAISTYQEALSENSRFEASIQALIRISHFEDYREQAGEILDPLLRVQERWDDLAELLRLKAEGTTDPFDRKTHLRALAEVHENGRQDPGAAFDALASALAEDGADEQIPIELERLAAATDGWSKLANILSSQASSLTDPMAARALYTQLARVAEEILSDDMRAVEAYTRALEQVGDDEELLLHLDRLYIKTENWSELGGVIERRIGMSMDDAERADLLLRLGEVRRDRFQDMRGAFASFQEVIEQNPSDQRAITALEGLSESPDLAQDVLEVLDNAFRETGATDQVATLYEVRIRLAESDGERVQMLQEVARLWEEELNDPAKAVDCTRRAFELDPRDQGLLEDLERLTAAAGAWEGLRGVVERLSDAGALDQEMQRDLNIRAATWYRDQLGDGAAAEQRLRAALEADTDAVEAHEMLVALLRTGERDEDLVIALRAWANIESDEYARRDRLREAARIAESSLGDVKTAGACLESILLSDPNDPEALDELARIRSAEEKWSQVVGLLERRADGEMDPTLRLDLKRRMAGILAGPLEDDDRATEAYVGVLDESPDDLEAIGALEGLYEKAESWDALRELLERRLDIAETDQDRIAARVRMARLDETAFGRREGAMSQLREILEIDPTNGEALDELERLLGLEQSWDELVELMERRLGDAAAAGDVEAQGAILGRMVDVHHDSRGDLAQAVTIQERLYSMQPDDVATLAKLITFQEESGDWAAVADSLSRLAGMQEAAEAIATELRVADLCMEKLEDAPRAEAAMRRAHELDPGATETRERLKAHFEAHEQHAELAQMLSIEAEEEQEEGPKVELLKRIAGIYRDQLDDPGSAASYFEKVVEFTPDDREALLPLCDLYIAAGRQPDAIPVLQKIIDSFGGRRSKELARYHHRLGKALDGMGDSAGALASYDAAFKIDLTNVEILRDLGKLTHGSGDYARAQKTFRALLLQKLTPESGISKADVYFYLGDISHKQGDATKAKSMLDRAVAEEKGHPQATALLEEMKG